MYVVTALVISFTFYFDDQYMSYGNMFTFPTMYFSLILFTLVFTATEKVFKSMRSQRKVARLNALEQADAKEKERLR